MHAPFVSLASFAHYCICEVLPCGFTYPRFVLFHGYVELHVMHLELYFPSYCSCIMSYLHFKAIENNASLNVLMYAFGAHVCAFPPRSRIAG